MQEVGVRSLVREWRSHMPRSVAKKKKCNSGLTIVKKEGKKGELDMENLSFQLASKVWRRSVRNSKTNITHQKSTFVTTHEPSLTHHCHPKSIVYIRIHFWWCKFYKFRQKYYDMYPSLWCHAEYFHCPKIPLCPPIHLSHTQPVAISGFFKLST